MSVIAGEHWIIEFYDCSSEVLDDVELLRAALQAACEKGALNLLQLVEHEFTPQGVTMLGLLSESHMSIHTWPEEGYAAIDIFTCGEKEQLKTAFDWLKATLKPKTHSLQIISRGSKLPTR